jgi:uncharacterized phage-associated protein
MRSSGRIMARAVDVARYLIHLAASEAEPQFLTHLQLQKLLYYVQGWSLAMRDVRMFSERIEAWANGPVVRDVYPDYAAYGHLPITYNTATTADNLCDCPGELDPSERELIESVWEVYKKYSAAHLWTMTHNEPPWIDARGNCAPADRCETEITIESMKAFFNKLAEA